MAQTTVADSSQLLVVRTAINDNATDAETRMSTNATDIGDNTTDIGTNTTNVALKADKLVTINNTSSGSYTLLSGDNTKHIKIDNTLIIPTGLAIGFQCSVFQDAATAQTLTTSGLTVIGNDQAANITSKGIISILVTATNTVLIAGEMEA